MKSSNENKFNYENVISKCPKCSNTNIFKRKNDLKTFKPILYKAVCCYKCNHNYSINGDISTPSYKHIYLDSFDFKKEKKYMQTILCYAQSIEIFLSYAIQLKLINLQLDDNLITYENFNCRSS